MAKDREQLPPSAQAVSDGESESGKFARLVKEKMAAGLPKDDAEEVARRQIEHDKGQG